MIAFLFVDIPGPALLSSMTQNSSAKGPGSGSATPSYSQFASFTSPPASQSGTPQPAFQAAAPPPPPQAQPASDPFAALGASVNTPAPTAPQPAAASNDDDEWNFSSALPPSTPSKPQEHKATVSNTNLRIEFIANRTPASSNAINALFAFTNNVAQPISELHFQLAVTKVLTFFTPLSHVRREKCSTNFFITGLRAPA